MRGDVDDCVCVQMDLSCLECRASFVWVDDTAVGYDGWSGPLKPTTKDCVKLSLTGWDDEDCETKLQHFCEQGK